jgi:hypothetical protein
MPCHHLLLLLHHGVLRLSHALLPPVGELLACLGIGSLICSTLLSLLCSQCLFYSCHGCIQRAHSVIHVNSYVDVGCRMHGVLGQQEKKGCFCCKSVLCILLGFKSFPLLAVIV